MPGTNAYQAKKALISLVRLALAANATTDQVTVTYAYRGDEHDRELVHGGRVEGAQSYPLSGGGSARFKRDETLTVRLHVVVTRPGDDQEAAEERATEIGAVIEEEVATTADLADLDGVIVAGVTAVDLDSDFDDDGSMAVLTYDVEVTSRLT